MRHPAGDALNPFRGGGEHQIRRGSREKVGCKSTAPSPELFQKSERGREIALSSSESFSDLAEPTRCNCRTWWSDRQGGSACRSRTRCSLFSFLLCSPPLAEQRETIQARARCRCSWDQCLMPSRCWCSLFSFLQRSMFNVFFRKCLSTCSVSAWSCSISTRV
jgi:hypothetical protein